MASHSHDVVESQQLTPKLQYSTSSTGVSPFWKEKYEKDAKKYWDIFYKRHQDKFFKDRHYLDKEWGHYFSGAGRKVILEVGCGAGNTTFPLISTYPEVFVHACDFSLRAVTLVKTHKDFNEDRVSAFVCDLTADDLTDQISPSSIDIVTMIFVLSAVSPEKMPLVLKNVKKVLKPNGYVLFRDYATGDLAQERFAGKDQKISENFYVRGDGTRAFYFSDESLTSLFEENGFSTQELGVCCKQVENRSRDLVMNRRWVQAVFRFSEGADSSAFKVDLTPQNTELETSKNTPAPIENIEVDMSEGVGVEMFGLSPSEDNEIIEVDLRGQNFKIEVLSKEHQHTCKSTGLMLWESARLMSSILARNPAIVTGKTVLELGCGCGICSMVAAPSSKLVVATDGDSKALDLLTRNITSNLKPQHLPKIIPKRLEWGNKDEIGAIKEVMNGKGFDVIIGTDVTYIPGAILPLFYTARELISSVEEKPSLILCHIFRRVDEPSILSAASQFGFRLVDRWPSMDLVDSGRSVIGSWFLEDGLEDSIPNSALHIMYFELA